jgi:hypothetical protein
MLTTTTPQLKRISAKEALVKIKAENYQAGEQYRLSDHVELKNSEKRTGQMLYHTDLIRRIEKITHKRVWAEDSIHDKAVCGFYTQHEGVKKFLGAFDKGPLPEFSHILTDDRDLPIKEKRGWRTVLTRLMQMKVITWPQVVYGFGDGRDNAAADRWSANSREFSAK